MAEMRREELMASLRGYLEDLLDTGVDELPFMDPPMEAAPVAPSTPPTPVQAAPSSPYGEEPAPIQVAPVAPTAAAETEPVTVAPATPSPVLPTHRHFPTNIAPEGSEAEVSSTAPPVQPAAAPTIPPAQHRQGAHSRLFRGYGNKQARLLFVVAGEGFKGESGDLLMKIIQAMGFTKEDICLLCFDEALVADSRLRPSLLKAITTVAPEVVVAMGEPAAQLMLQQGKPVSALRGRFAEMDGFAVMATLDPDSLLEDATLKRQVWQDMQQVMRRLGVERSS